MGFILDDEAFLEKLNFDAIKECYEQKTGAKLDKSSPSALFTTLGYHDTTTRSLQIRALTWLHNHFEDYLNFKLPQNFQGEKGLDEVLTVQSQRLMALNVLVASCIYIIETNKTGVLVEMLNEFLGVNTVNKIDEEVRNMCLLNAKKYFNDINITSSSTHIELDIKSFFIDLSIYAEKEAKEVQDLSNKSNFPCARLGMVTLAWPAGMLGYSIGALAGQAISRSTAMQNAQWTITAAVGSFIYMVMGPTAGITLLAPTIAHQTLSNAFGLSTAFVLGKTFGFAGQLVGATIGLPFDLLWILASTTSSAMFDLVWSKSGDQYPEHGISLIDGTYYENGQSVVIELKSEDEMAKLGVLGTIDPTHESEMINELKAVLQDKLNKLPATPFEENSPSTLDIEKAPVI